MKSLKCRDCGCDLDEQDDSCLDLEEKLDAAFKNLCDECYGAERDLMLIEEEEKKDARNEEM